MKGFVFLARKAQITREMITEAAISVIREGGIENFSVRSVAAKLQCSTQPVLYYYDTVKELKAAAYQRAAAFHTEYLLHPRSDKTDSLLAMGLNYIEFAKEEMYLFRFLFQSGMILEHSLSEMITADDMVPVLDAMQKEMQLSYEDTKKVFLTLALCVHGYASLIANNSLAFDEAAIVSQLQHVYKGARLALQDNRE